MRVFVSLVSVLLLCVTTVQPQPSFAAKRKKVKAHRGYYSGVSFLKFSQVAKLPRNERAQYIRLLRRMFLDVERFQEEFHKASNAWIPKQKKQDIYSMLFGRDLYAADGDCEVKNADGTCGTHKRGAQCADRCIYGFNLNYYKKNSKGECRGFPFGCSLPKEQRCNRGGSTKGVQCDTSVSGLSGNDGCAPNDLSRGVTRWCNQKMTTLAHGFEKSGKLEKLMNDIDAAFGFNEGTVSDEFLNSEAARKFIAKLVATRYSDQSYATLITLMELYKKRGLRFPTDDPKVLSLQQDFDGFIGILDGVFGDYMQMCDTELANGVINDIRDLKNATPGTFNYGLDKARKELLEEAEKKGEVITSRNVLQKPECVLVTAKMNGIIRASEELARQLPTGEKPPGRVPPPPPPEPVDKIRPVGCSNGGDLNNSLIFNPIGRCSLCAMEKAVNNIGNGNVVDQDAMPLYGEKPTTGEYMVSKKWTALLSTMMKACGTSTGAGSDVESMNEMWQTFGSCSQDTYDWDTGDQFLAENDIDKIEAWANFNYWNGQGKEPTKAGFWGRMIGKRDKPEPDKNDDFARIFGVSYRAATEIFCDSSRFDSPDFEIRTKENGRTRIIRAKKGKNKKPEGQPSMSRSETRKIDRAVEKACKHHTSNRAKFNCEKIERDKLLGERAGVNTTRNPVTKRITRLKAGQKRMRYAINNNYIKAEAPPGVDSAAKGLISCMEEGLERAKRSSDPDQPGAMCMASVTVDPNTLEEQMSSKTSPGNILVDDQSCMVGTQVEDYGPNDSKKTLAFMSTEAVSDAVRRPAKGTREFHKSTKPVLADPLMERRSIMDNPAQANKREGLTVDCYAPFGSVYGCKEGLMNYTQMTKQVSCRDYWGSPDYRVGAPSPSSRGSQ